MLYDTQLEHRPFKIFRTMIELTRKCNLRCKYCAVSSPNWEHKDMDLSEIDIDEIIKHLKSVGNKQIVLHGHGETTIVPKWDEYARKFLDNGFELVICTNLAKTYTNEEINILSKFVSITVSIDSFDEQQFSDLRKGGQLSKVVYNMVRINTIRAKLNTSGDWGWSCVIVKENIHGLIDLVYAGLQLGVKTFSLCNLTKINNVDLTHLSELNRADAIKAVETLDTAKNICEKNNAYFDLKGGLIESLEIACKA